MLTFSRYLCSFGFFEKRYFIWILFCFRFLFSFSLAFTFLRCCLLTNCCCCLLRYAHTQNMYTHTTAHKLDFIATLHLISLWYTYDTYFFTCFYFNSVFGFYVLVKNRHRQMDPFPGKSALWITYFFPLFHSTKVVHPMLYKMWMNNSDYVGDCNQNHQQHYHRRLFVENEKSLMNAFRFHSILCENECEWNRLAVRDFDDYFHRRSELIAYFPPHICTSCVCIGWAMVINHWMNHIYMCLDCTRCAHREKQTRNYQILKLHFHGTFYLLCQLRTILHFSLRFHFIFSFFCFPFRLWNSYDNCTIFRFVFFSTNFCVDTKQFTHMIYQLHNCST